MLFVVFFIPLNSLDAQTGKFNYDLIKQDRFKRMVNDAADTTEPVVQKKEIKRKKISLGGIFLSAGTGLSIPLKKFNENSNPAFGLLGRLEYSTYKIFPLVIGGEVTYFSYNGADLFKTTNLLNTFKTKILSYGITLEYTLSKLLNSSYTIPFVMLDVKINSIKREYDAGHTFSDLPAKDSKISVGAGFGFTLFVLDFYLKYNYMKDQNNFGVYTKIKFPIIRF